MLVAVKSNRLPMREVKIENLKVQLRQYNYGTFCVSIYDESSMYPNVAKKSWHLKEGEEGRKAITYWFEYVARSIRNNLSHGINMLPDFLMNTTDDDLMYLMDHVIPILERKCRPYVE